MNARRIGIALTLLLLASTAHAADLLQLTLFRAVRVSDTTVTLSFVTDQRSIGTLTYTGSGERTITLTDATPQIDHIFTMEDLDPSKAYSFTLSAMNGRQGSDKFVILLSPGTIGALGQSVSPAVQELDGNGKLVYSQLAASSTPSFPHTLPLGLGILVVAAGFAAWLAYSRRKQYPPQF